tara:strand:+ start:860 stop:1051 length:192 start_codon:yes stop_codon:yes gene_type:complete
MLKVKGHSNLYRDENTGAILNCDQSGYSNYIKSRERMSAQRSEIDNIKAELDEIKSLLKQIIN